MSIDRPDHLLELLEALCEDRLTSAQMADLERIIRSDRTARRLYLDYIDLHGTLYWDTARGAVPEFDGRAASGLNGAMSRPLPPQVDAPGRGANRRHSAPASPAGARQRWRWRAAAIVVAACGILLAFVALNQFPDSGGAGPGIAVEPGEGQNAPNPADGRGRRLEPIQLAVPDRPSGHRGELEKAIQPDDSAADPAVDSAGQPLLAFIDEQLRRGWEAAEIEPSPQADDAEWLRRVYLDIVGHIPPAEAVEKFLADPSPRKRAVVIDRLLDDPAYVHNWTTIWTNLLVGRSTERDIDRPALQRFLRNQIARNRPWSETVYDLVSAEGEADENGAANFLLAHVNNQAVPATAITARMFLGVQFHCTQCHDHPFNKTWKQDQFWELNSFFKQTEVVRREKRDPQTGRMLREIALVSREEGGPTFYETRNGLMRVAYPEFSGTKVSPESGINRREELARLMVEGDDPLIASALVNRLWAHFFGYGFTRPIDDMGPHNPPTHPEVLERLSREFVRNGFDVKQLIRWICLTDAYQRTSRYGSSNTIDDPAAGEAPLFSRVYMKPMTVEQVYDSLLIATRADQAGRSNWSDVARQRQQWLQQFVHAFGTDENDEATTFEGTIPQALTMMNGELVDEALAARSGTLFHEVVQQRGSEVDKIRRLCLAALSRYPTAEELARIRKSLRERAAQSENPRAAVVQGLQDLFWAYLNSSEFLLVH